MSLTASARNLAMVKFGERRRAAAQTSAASAGSPLSAKAIALAVARKVSKRVDVDPSIRVG